MLCLCIFFLLVGPKTGSACMDDQCRELEFPGYYVFYGVRLINHVIRTIKVLDQDSCELQCYLEHNCVSVNFKFTGTHNCDLNNSTHKEHEEELVKRDGYIYHGTKNACGNGPCLNNATCQTGFTIKGYRCLCASGFTGHECDYDIDECKDKDTCDTNAICNNTKGSYTCACEAGYTGDGENCEDIDECARSSHNCSKEGSLCYNTRGSFNCTCKPGFTGDGHNCTDVDECAENTHNCSKDGGLCKNVKESFNCTCKPGFTGDGLNCTDIDECYQGVNNNCSEHAHCNNTAGSYNCTCNDEYFGDGYNCTKSEFIINSTILSNNQYYLHHLRRFLAPAVGEISAWVLCYRQSLHNDYDTIFHDNCDGKENTITIVKESAFVFGGYTDIPWESNNTDLKWYGSSSKAFIFSLHDNEDLGPFKGMVKNRNKAIYNHRYYGPTFGNEDIKIDRAGVRKKNQSTTNFGIDYFAPKNVHNSMTILAGVYKFHPDEVEVFYLKEN